MKLNQDCFDQMRSYLDFKSLHRTCAVSKSWADVSRVQKKLDVTTCVPPDSVSLENLISLQFGEVEDVVTLDGSKLQHLLDQSQTSLQSLHLFRTNANLAGPSLPKVTKFSATYISQTTLLSTVSLLPNIHDLNLFGLQLDVLDFSHFPNLRNFKIEYCTIVQFRNTNLFQAKRVTSQIERFQDFFLNNAQFVELENCIMPVSFDEMFDFAGRIIKKKPDIEVYVTLDFDEDITLFDTSIDVRMKPNAITFEKIFIDETDFERHALEMANQLGRMVDRMREIRDAEFWLGPDAQDFGEKEVKLLFGLISMSQKFTRREMSRMLLG